MRRDGYVYIKELRYDTNQRFVALTGHSHRMSRVINPISSSLSRQELLYVVAWVNAFILYASILMSSLLLRGREISRFAFSSSIHLRAPFALVTLDHRPLSPFTPQSQSLTRHFAPRAPYNYHSSSNLAPSRGSIWSSITTSITTDGCKTDSS